jgi:DNA/RNA-binding protein KIN17
MSILKLYYANIQVQANKVYKEYIRDRQHIHMNSTKWETLAIFLKVI